VTKGQETKKFETRVFLKKSCRNPVNGESNKLYQNIYEIVPD
jgi:hypothetical protein